MAWDLWMHALKFAKFPVIFVKHRLESALTEGIGAFLVEHDFKWALRQQTLRPSFHPLHRFEVKWKPPPEMTRRGDSECSRGNHDLL